MVTVAETIILESTQLPLREVAFAEDKYTGPVIPEALNRTQMPARPLTFTLLYMLLSASITRPYFTISRAGPLISVTENRYHCSRSDLASRNFQIEGTINSMISID